MTAYYLTVAEVAARCRVSDSTIYHLIDRGELQATRIGRRVIVAETDLVEYLERNATKRRPPAPTPAEPIVYRRTRGARRYQ